MKAIQPRQQMVATVSITQDGHVPLKVYNARMRIKIKIKTGKLLNRNVICDTKYINFNCLKVQYASSPFAKRKDKELRSFLFT